MIETEVPSLSHINTDGQIKMVDVGEKSANARTAFATGRVLLGEEAFRQVKENQIKKGDVLTTAKIAGIQGAKHTSLLIPLCHNIYLQNITVEAELNEEVLSVDIRAFVKTYGQTGVEMEALSAVSAAALTVYDMCKSVSKDITITQIRLQAKTGGLSGDYRRLHDN
ncbi:MAG TPA: cyclic pyranopterin monophosphate synthase MoaC [Rhodothermales bacterium]|nr:cyclic pyranopterin monophosphate synthase MoaC [Rhodothermales bacterium]